MSESGLTIAVTGPTGTFGHGLMPQLEADDRVDRVVGIARRPFDPAVEGWTKMEYRRGDVRDLDALTEAFTGADVVVHLAFVIVGGDRERTRQVNVEGTLNAFRAAVAAGARRFVYASSVAAYGFHRDNPVGMREEWPTRPADRLFYAREKAELERLLEEEAQRHPEVGLYVLRPHIVVGPHTVGAKAHVPTVVGLLGRSALNAVRRSPVPLPVPLPDLELQLVHEEDVGLALLQCVVAAGPPGAYNIAADVIGVHDIARELGLLPVPLPTGPTRTGARMLAKAPGLPQVAEWVEVASHPAVMDTTRARQLLGWEPQWTAVEALRDTLPR